jgi:hypothetical protein
VERGDLCEAVANLHANIQAAVMVSGGEIKERYVRPGVPVPPALELERLFLRAEVFASMTRESDHLFGRTEYILTSHEMLDTFIFPVKGRGVLIVPVAKTYDSKELLGRIASLLRAG